MDSHIASTSLYTDRVPKSHFINATMALSNLSLAPVSNDVLMADNSCVSHDMAWNAARSRPKVTQGLFLNRLMVFPTQFEDI